MAVDPRALAETAANQQRFLDAYRKVGTVTGAASLAGVGRRTHYDWLESDEAYRAAFSEAVETATDALEQEARRRALLGVKEDVYYRGRVVGAQRKHSDTLLIFLLKAYRPDKFKDRHEHTGKDGAPIQVRHSTIDLRHATDDELAALDALHERLAQRALAAAVSEDDAIAAAAVRDDDEPSDGDEPAS